MCSQDELRIWLLSWFGHAKEEEKMVMIMVLYQIWLARNAARDGKLIEDPRSMVDRTWHLIEEWGEVHAVHATTADGEAGGTLMPTLA